jgi:hypothetical protein
LATDRSPRVGGRLAGGTGRALEAPIDSLIIEPDTSKALVGLRSNFG